MSTNSPVSSRLGEARLVAIGRRDGEKSRQDAQQRHHREHTERARMRADREIGDGSKAMRGRRPFALAAGRDRHVASCPLALAKVLPHNREFGAAGEGRRPDAGHSGRREAASRESMSRRRDYGFRARAFGASRNDGKELPHAHTATAAAPRRCRLRPRRPSRSAARSPARPARRTACGGRRRRRATACR